MRQAARLRSLIAFIKGFKEQNPAARKVDVQQAIEERFAVVKERSIYRLEDGALRISGFLSEKCNCG